MSTCSELFQGSPIPLAFIGSSRALPSLPTIIRVSPLPSPECPALKRPNTHSRPLLSFSPAFPDARLCQHASSHG